MEFHRRCFDSVWNDTASMDGDMDSREDVGVRIPLDALVFETIPYLSEVRALLRLL